ncbi:unnamed protein product [Gadus morhua 'NCC']
MLQPVPVKAAVQHSQVANDELAKGRRSDRTSLSSDFIREDLESEQGWIEVIWPTQRRQQEAKPIAAKLLFFGDTVREKFPNTMVSEIRALLRRKCNNEGYTKVAPQ